MSEERTADQIRRAQHGDRRAFDQLLDRHRSALDTFVSRRLGAHLRRLVDAEDIRQETLAKAWRAIDRFEPRSDGSFLRWLEAIAEHVILALARKQRREHQVCFHEDRAAADEVPPSRAARRAERFDRLEAALDKLSTVHRQVIVLARIDGIPVREIARRLDRTPNAVSLLLVRALRELKRHFGDTDSLHLPPRRLDDLGRGAHDDDAR